jgi:hypothetical protein
VSAPSAPPSVATSAPANSGGNPGQYKKGQNQQDFDANAKCDDLILYSDSYPYGLGCSVCNYAPNSLRYLRDHIRKVHLAKTYKCTYCELRTKRRADLVRHIKRIHEDPKRNAAAAAASGGGGGGGSINEFMPH